MNDSLFGSEHQWLDDVGEDEDEEEPRAVAREPQPSTPPPLSRPPSAATAGRRIRVKPMGDELQRKHPTVVSILTTHSDGRQVLLVRRGV